MSHLSSTPSIYYVADCGKPTYNNAAKRLATVYVVSERTAATRKRLAKSRLSSQILAAYFAQPCHDGSPAVNSCTSADARELRHVQPGLPCRLHRPYLSANFNRKDALSTLCFHYQTLACTVPENLLRQHLSPKGATCINNRQDDASYFIDICAIADLDKEAEATLVMKNEEGTILAELTFTLCEHQGKSTLFIGGLQGAKSWVPHEAIQKATKACHGLFPKRLLPEAACLFAKHIKIDRILAVSNSTHIYRSWRYQKKKKDKLHADYDTFRGSMSGEMLPGGYFHMPNQVARKPLEEIASKKRAEYRRRYELLDSLGSTNRQPVLIRPAACQPQHARKHFT